MNETRARRGRYIQTYTGIKFWPLDTEPQEILLEDIAHALANNCRFTGHCLEFYSVAQHSVIVSNVVPDEHARWGLLHDAAEAYLSDIARPIKPFLRDYGPIEARLMRAIAERFGLNGPIPREVEIADFNVLMTERRDLMAPTDDVWESQDLAHPLLETITPLPTKHAEYLFLRRAHELKIDSAGVALRRFSCGREG